ncbi:Ku protein [Candidatus Nephthysia bennettiae]|uniref:Non-homologous end joining protein Ku n=1 Tax=Candidatus Nephthysia bennettiae TaxID=3127016 RepID=A0A934N1S3_9BACT|nr:Ku protein [Candidatus Dormibacteraeota bacterium]
MSALWKGVIGFGLVSIPVRLDAAIDSRSVSFRQLCGEHTSPLRYRRWCDAGDHEVSYPEVKKGYEISTDHYVVIEDSDLDHLPLPTTHTIEISEFVPLHQIQPSLYFKSAYYVAPEKTGQKPYYLLKQALEKTGLAAIAKVAFRDREHLCALLPMDSQLVMNTLHWPHEIRPVKGLSGDVKIHRMELQMAESLVRSLAEERFDPNRYRDNFHAALMQVVNAKIEGAEVIPAPKMATSAVMSLIEALEASVEVAKKQRAAERAPTKKVARGPRKSASSSLP